MSDIEKLLGLITDPEGTIESMEREANRSEGPRTSQPFYDKVFVTLMC